MSRHNAFRNIAFHAATTPIRHFDEFFFSLDAYFIVERHD